MKKRSCFGHQFALTFFAFSLALSASAEDEILSYDAGFFEQAQVRTALDIIGRLPGFSFDPGTVVRGFAATAGNVLVDGQRPTSKTDTLSQVLQRIPADHVQRIDVIRGSGSSIDMQGHSVVANVIRKTSQSRSTIATIENDFFTNGRMAPAARIEVNGRKGDTSYQGVLSVFRFFGAFAGATGERQLIEPSGVVRRNDGGRQEVHRTGGELAGGITQPLRSGDLRANILFQHEPSRVTRSYASASEYVDTHNGASTGELGASWTGTSGLNQTQALFLQRLAEETLTDTFDSAITSRQFSSRSVASESIAALSVRRSITDAFSLEAGVEGAFNYLDGHTSFAVDGSVVPLPSADARVEESRGEVFTQVSWKPSQHSELEIGSRLEISEIKFEGDGQLSQSFQYPKPRALFTWSPNQQSQLRFRYEKIVGQLDFGNFIATSNLAESGITSGNSALRPDQRSQYEIAFERHFWDRGAIVLSLMHEEITDVVDFAPFISTAGVFDAPANIGDGRNQRMEASLTLPLERVYIAGGMLDFDGTWNSSQVRDPVTLQKRIISNQYAQTISVRFVQDLPQMKSSWGITYLGLSEQRRYRLTQTEIARAIPSGVGNLAPSLGLDALGNLSVFWTYKPNPSLALHLEMMNVTGFVRRNRRDIYAGPRDAAPIAVTEHVTWKSVPVVAIQLRGTF